MMKKIHGSCLCGRIQFSVDDQFAYAGYCHCSMCRKASGATASAIGGVSEEHFTLVTGEEHLHRYQRSEASISYSCAHCASTLYGSKPDTGMIHVRYGVLDQSPTLTPQAHMHVGSKADWYQITDDLPQFEGFPPL